MIVIIFILTPFQANGSMVLDTTTGHVIWSPKYTGSIKTLKLEVTETAVELYIFVNGTKGKVSFTLDASVSEVEPDKGKGGCFSVQFIA